MEERPDEQQVLEIDYSIASKEAIEALLAEVVEPNIYEEVLRLNTKRPEILRLLLENPDTPQHILEEASKILHAPLPALKQTEETPGKYAARSETLLQKIQKLTVSERRMLAMRGGREARSILIKDTNKQVMMAVLANPKISETEIEILAHSRSIPDDALRTITKNKEWMKSYGIIHAVATNPKTPPGVAIPLLSSLKTKDIAAIEKNKNVSDALRTAAKKLTAARKPH